MDSAVTTAETYNDISELGGDLEAVFRLLEEETLNLFDEEIKSGDIDAVISKIGQSI